MLNRSEIFRKAWAEYRYQTAWRANRAFDRKLFASILRDNWADAKAEAAEKASAATVTRADAIRAELQDMELGSFIDWNRRRDLTAELNRLGG